MVKLTVQDISEIHLAVEERYNFKHFEKGIRNKGLLDIIADRPYLKVYGYEPFPDIYSKCASLIEGIAKFHPFINGNKRTALAVASAYMNVNGYKIAIPFPAVKYSVIIANDKEDRIKPQHIARWIRQISSKDDDLEYFQKLEEFIIKPAQQVLDLYGTERYHKADAILADWLAYDIYPEYRFERQHTISFLIDIIKQKYKI